MNLGQGHFMLDPDFKIGAGYDDDPQFEWLRGGETRYYEFALKRIITAILQRNVPPNLLIAFASKNMV